MPEIDWEAVGYVVAGVLLAVAEVRRRLEAKRREDAECRCSELELELHQEDPRDHGGDPS